MAMSKKTAGKAVAGKSKTVTAVAGPAKKETCQEGIVGAPIVRRTTLPPHH
jgi:hypothetical protein